MQAPEVVANYNKGMDGVDRHDQYRQLFSLCKTHGFKKYYVKLALALFDMAIVNAVLHFKLRWKDSEDTSKSKMSRADFMQEIATKLMSQDSAWAKEDSDVATDPFELHSPSQSQGQHAINEASCNPVCIETRNLHQKGCRIEAIQKYASTLDYFMRRCQICDYEQRGKKRVANVLVCLTHGIKACGIVRPPLSEEKRKLLVRGTDDPVTDFSWMCDDNAELTCMEKFHSFYLPRQLFKPKAITIVPNKKTMFATIRMTSDIYKRRQVALGLRLGKRGRKKREGSKGEKDDEKDGNASNSSNDEKNYEKDGNASNSSNDEEVQESDDNYNKNTDKWENYSDYDDSSQSTITQTEV